MSDQKPSLGRIVLVKTPDRLNGQEESVAIVTQVWDGDMINVTIFPGTGSPVSVGSVYRAEHPYAGPYSWRWPVAAR